MNANPHPPVLDPEILDQLVVLGASDGRELLTELCTRFEEAIERRLELLRTSGADLGVWARVLHQTRGSAANVGARRLASLAEELEGVALGGGDPRPRFEELEREARAASKAVKSHLHAEC